MKLLNFSNDIYEKNCNTLNSLIQLWKELFCFFFYSQDKSFSKLKCLQIYPSYRFNLSQVLVFLNSLAFFFFFFFFNIYLHNKGLNRKSNYIQNFVTNIHWPPSSLSAEHCIKEEDWVLIHSENESCPIS